MNKKLTATNTFIDLLKRDKALFEAYQANIAMSFVDSAIWYKRKHQKRVLSNKDIHKIANEAATHFLNMLINFK
jgi:hypothetical protein